MKYAFPNLSKKQRQILDEIGCGNYSLASVFPTPQAIAGLLERKLIEQCGEQRIGQGAFTIKISEYQMPLAIHFAWSTWQAEQYDADQQKKGGEHECAS